jgi:DNA repair exonuclease SbcCD nuclease subunit
MMESVLAIARKLASENSIDEIVNMGDTFHTFEFINQYCQEVAIEFFRSLAAIRPLTVIVGNHDRPSHNEFLTNHHPFHGVENDPKIRIVWKSYAEWREEIDGYVVWMPYVQKGLHEKALKEITFLSLSKEDEKINEKTYENLLQRPGIDSRILVEFSHGEYQGAMMSGRQSKKGDPWGLWPNVSGHIHDHQYLGKTETIGNETVVSGVLYVGTPIQVAVNESDYKTLSLVRVPPYERGKPKVVYETRIPLMCCVMKTIVVDYEGFLSWREDNMPLDEFHRKTRWVVVVEDTTDKLRALGSTPQYDLLISSGVIVKSRPRRGKPEDRIQEKVDSKETPSREKTYIMSLFDRISDNKDLVELLERIVQH